MNSLYVKKSGFEDFSYCCMKSFKSESKIKWSWTDFMLLTCKNLFRQRELITPDPLELLSCLRIF